MSLIIFAGIVVGLPRAVREVYSKGFETGEWQLYHLLLLVALMLVVVGIIVMVESAQRRIPVQYARRVVGRKVVGGTMTYLPIRVNAGGVIPVIFASSVLAFPQTIGTLFPNNPYMKAFTQRLAWGEPLYTLLYVDRKSVV